MRRYGLKNTPLFVVLPAVTAWASISDWESFGTLAGAALGIFLADSVVGGVGTQMAGAVLGAVAGNRVGRRIERERLLQGYLHA